MKTTKKWRNNYFKDYKKIELTAHFRSIKNGTDKYSKLEVFILINFFKYMQGNSKLSIGALNVRY